MLRELLLGLAGVALVAAIGIGLTSSMVPKPTPSQSVSRANPVVMSGVIATK